MPGSSADLAPWAEVGEMLQDRRGELDPRYANRQVFADEQGISYRVIWDIEHGRRANFGRSMLSAIEVAYGLARGSVMRAVQGGDFEPARGAPPTTPRVRRELRIIGDAIAEDEEEPSGGAESGSGTA